MTDFITTPGGLLVDGDFLDRAALREQITTCPAAELTESEGQPAIRCGIAGEVMLIARNPAGCGAWCCGPLYAHEQHGCPIWLDERRDGGVRQARVDAAVEARETGRRTVEQIERGTRVDDHGLES